MPEASAATSELRTASTARPDAERCRLWMTSVITPNTSSASIASSRGWVKSNGPNGNSDSNVSRLSGGTGHPREPFLI